MSLLALLLALLFGSVSAAALGAGGASQSQIACQLSAGAGVPFSWSLVDVASGTLLMSGEQAAVHLDGQWWQARGSTAPGARQLKLLKLLRSGPINGTDQLGRYAGTALSWGTDTAAVWETACKTYETAAGSAHAGVVVFESGFPEGATGTAVPAASSSDGVLSNFPLATDVNATAFLSWGGVFLRPSNRVTHGLSGGPVVFFDPDDPEGRSSTVVVGSPLDNFKATSQASKAFDGSAASWAPGTAGTITSLDKGYVHRFVVVAPTRDPATGNAGVTAAVRAYGLMMQSLHNTTRIDTDKTVTGLQYQTDNGAQYCFCKEECDAKLEQTIKGLQGSNGRYPKVQSLSFQGGWWKNKLLDTTCGSNCAPWCVSTWEPNTTKFPTGYQIAKEVALPFQLYAPYFCMDTPYARDWPMLSSDTTLPGCDGFGFKTASPDYSEAFYKWFMGFGKTRWGMTSFEPDFLRQNSICVPEFLENATAQHTWFNGMASAADSLGLAMQWCMATPSDLLLALDYPSVTNLRVTSDYYYGNSWDVGPGSLLLWSLGAAPSKDTFWTSNQSDIAVGLGGCPAKGCPADHSEAGAELHTLLALFTTGPVGFSDAAGRSNATLLWRIAVADGTLIPPSKPLTPSDRVYSAAWKKGHHGYWDTGHLLSTHSGTSESVDDIWAFYIVAHQLNTAFTPDPSRDLHPGVTHQKFLWRAWDAAAATRCKNGTSLAGCGVSAAVPAFTAAEKGAEFYRPQLSVGVRLCDSGFALLGDLGKYASASALLFPGLQCTAAGMSVQVGKHDVEQLAIVRPCPNGESKVMVVPAKAGASLQFSSQAC